jgi:hypothetical protein
MAGKHSVLEQFRRMFVDPWPPPRTPPPDGMTDPLAIELWNVIAAPMFDREAFDAVLQKHAPTIIAASMRRFAETSGAADEVELYA